ncbi:hypothetical protein [Microbacterium kunmingense]|uniref:hypothetical protein n=1 Tax=Microbacterium kunmingense TaxID=2915939 RepID=UPI002002A903|nr:hypothetical protein [Microbacterium kunmingense]
MTLTVDERPHALVELLWLREAHHLEPQGANLPPLLSDTPDDASIASDAATRADWERLWPQVWHNALDHVGRETDPRLFDRVQETIDGSPERAALLREIVGPDVRDYFGHDTFADASYRKWEQKGMDEFISSRPRALEESPERRDLDALIPAWRAGLTRIVTIPCREVHTHKIGPNTLLVTERTRADSESFRHALAAFF